MHSSKKMQGTSNYPLSSFADCFAQYVVIADDGSNLVVASVKDSELISLKESMRERFRGVG